MQSTLNANIPPENRLIHILNEQHDRKITETVLKNDHISTVIQIKDWVFKVSYAKKTTEKLKTWLKRDRVSKEIKGNLLLTHAGIQTPKIQEAYLNYSLNQQALGLLIMDFIPESTTLRDFWIAHSPQMAEPFIQKFLQDTNKLLELKVQINDYGPHNILVSGNRLIWIDAIACKTQLNEQHYYQRFSKQIQRVIDSDAQFWNPSTKRALSYLAATYPLDIQF